MTKILASGIRETLNGPDTRVAAGAIQSPNFTIPDGASPTSTFFVLAAGARIFSAEAVISATRSGWGIPAYKSLTRVARSIGLTISVNNPLYQERTAKGLPIAVTWTSSAGVPKNNAPKKRAVKQRDEV